MSDHNGFMGYHGKHRLLYVRRIMRQASRDIILGCDSDRRTVVGLLSEMTQMGSMHGRRRSRAQTLVTSYSTYEDRRYLRGLKTFSTPILGDRIYRNVISKTTSAPLVFVNGLGRSIARSSVRDGGLENIRKMGDYRSMSLTGSETFYRKIKVRVLDTVPLTQV